MSRPRPSPYGRPRSLPASACLLGALVLTGCGAVETAAPQAPASTSPSGSTSASARTSTSASPSPSPATTPRAASASPSPKGAAKSWTATGPSFGVDRAEWPGDFAGAKALLRGLPGRLAGEDRELYSSTEEGKDAGAQFGDQRYVTVSTEYVTRDTPSGEPETMSANDLLFASFGLVFSCAKGSYEGNVPPMSFEKNGPAAGPDTRKAGSKPVWFSCRIDGAEGDDDFSAHAVGWTSKKTAWMVVAPDRQAVRALVVALHDAAR